MPFPPQPGEPLLTDRLELRVPTEADLDAIFAIHRDPRAFAYDSTPPVTTRDRMRDVLGAWLAEREIQGFGYCTVHPRQHRPAPGGIQEPECADDPLTDPGLLLGVCGLTRYVLNDRTVLSAYYRFRPEAWGHGIAAEALRAVLAQAARALPGAETVVITDRGNAPSRTLAERLGYRLTSQTVPDEDSLVVLSALLPARTAR